jgi:hypothetical protein
MKWLCCDGERCYLSQGADNPGETAQLKKESFCAL